MNRFDLAYLAAAVPAAPFGLFKFLTDGRYRHALGERFGGATFHGAGQPIWLHAASVGEVNAARPLIEALRPERVVVTTLTRTGRDRAKALEGPIEVAYAPLDLSGFVGRAFRRRRPKALILIEQEFWPNLILGAASAGVPVIVANAKLGENSLARYRKAQHLFARVVGAIGLVLAQDERHAARWAELGVAASRVRVVGNLKFDVPAPAVDAAALRRELGIEAGAPVIVGGSTHAPEEEWLLGAYTALKRSKPGLRLILAPRYPARGDEVADLVAKAGVPCYKRSAPAPVSDAVVVIDRLGELSKLYAAAQAAFVGGTIAPRGGHNLLEPLAFGVPVVTGPDLENVRELADELRRRDALDIAESRDALRDALDRLLDAPRERGERGREVVKAGAGSVRRHADAIRAYLS